MDAEERAHSEIRLTSAAAAAAIAFFRFARQTAGFPPQLMFDRWLLRFRNGTKVLDDQTGVIANNLAGVQ